MLLRELYIPPKDAVEVEHPETGFTYKVDKKKAVALVKKGWKIVQVHHEEDDLDEGPTWARSGKKVVRKYRCAGGPRKNRKHFFYESRVVSVYHNVSKRQVFVIFISV